MGEKIALQRIVTFANQPPAHGVVPDRLFRKLLLRVDHPNPRNLVAVHLDVSLDPICRRSDQVAVQFNIALAYREPKCDAGTIDFSRPDLIVAGTFAKGSGFRVREVPSC